MEINFEIAKQTDVDIILEMMRELYANDKIPFDEVAAQNALIKFIWDDSLGRFWLIKIENEIIGYVILTFGYSIEYHGRDTFIDELYIKSDYRSKGIGTKVIEFIESQSRSLGIEAIHLEVERENENAQNFYRKIGFEDHDRYLMTKWIA